MNAPETGCTIIVMKAYFRAHGINISVLADSRSIVCRLSCGEHTTVTEVTPVPPVSPVSPVQPVVIHDTVTNVVERPVSVAEEVQVRVVSLEYDGTTCKGILTVEIVSGSFKKANKCIRKNFDDLVRKKSPAEDAAKIFTDAKLEIESISINEGDRCEVKFAVTKERGAP